MSISYTLLIRLLPHIITEDTMYDEEEYHLTAKTDTGARRQAGVILKNINMTGKQAFLSFYRSSDGCDGTMDL